MDLTPNVTIDRRIRLPLSQGRGHGDESLFCVMGSGVSKSMVGLGRLWLDLTISTSSMRRPILTINQHVRLPLFQAL